MTHTRGWKETSTKAVLLLALPLLSESVSVANPLCSVFPFNLFTFGPYWRGTVY